MLDPNRQYLFLRWPQYLAQWYAYEQHAIRYASREYKPEYVYRTDVPAYELEPVETLRGSVERNILHLNLTKQPNDTPDIPSDDTTICIQLPVFADKRPDYYNYLPAPAVALLEETVRNRVKLDAFRYIQKIYDGSGHALKLDDVIVAYMERHGIENNETNLATIRQIYYRCKDVYRKHNKE